MNKRTFLLGSLGAVALGAGAWLQSRTPSSAAAHPAVEELFSGKILRVDGFAYPMSQHRGTAMLVNVWAPWCAPCVEELPELSALSMTKEAKSIQFLGLGVDNAQNISDFTVKHPVAFPLLVAGLAGTRLAKSLGNNSGALPFTVLINKKGEPVTSKTGRVTAKEIIGWMSKL